MSTQNERSTVRKTGARSVLATVVAIYLALGGRLEAVLYRLGERWVGFAHPGDELALASYRATAARYGRADRAQTTNIAGLFIGIMVAVIIGVDVVIPVITDSIANSSVSGNTETILDLLPLFIALLLLIALASPLMNRL